MLLGVLPPHSLVPAIVCTEQCPAALQVGARCGSLVLAVPSHVSGPPPRVVITASNGYKAARALDLHPASVHAVATTAAPPGAAAAAATSAATAGPPIRQSFGYAAVLADCEAALSAPGPSAEFTVLLVFDLYRPGLPGYRPQVTSPSAPDFNVFRSLPHAAAVQPEPYGAVQAAELLQAPPIAPAPEPQQQQLAVCKAVEEWAAAAWNRGMLLEQADKVEAFLR